jgi:DNA invertase Pin-like site-specific DNA recombinase
VNGSNAVAYLRRSRVDDRRPGLVSWDNQLDAVRKLAAVHGDTLTDDRILGEKDWGRSGKGSKTHLRPDYARLREMIAAGSVSAIYSYNLSRLARSVQEVLSLADLCREHGVAIRLAKDVDPDTTTASGRMLLGILAVVAQWQTETAAESSIESAARRDKLGLHNGRTRYGAEDGEDASAVRDAFREAGTYVGAARLLNERNVPTRFGKPWYASSVGWVIRKQYPALAPVNPKAGARSRQSFYLGRLLRCHCGRTLSATRKPNGRQAEYVTYRCDNGPNLPNHGRPFVVSEPMILPWVKDQMKRMHTPERAKLAEDQKGQREALEDRKARILDSHEAGHHDAAERDRRLQVVYDAMTTLDEAERLVSVPRLDWSWAIEDVNNVLRLAIDHIELGRDLRPVRIVPGVPEWWT